MKQEMKYKGYSGSVEYSAADDCLFGRIIGIDDIVSYEGQSVDEIRQAFHEAVDDYLEDCAASGRLPNKPYSGKFVIRISPELHARLASSARDAGMSLNQYAAEKLAQA